MRTYTEHLERENKKLKRKLRANGAGQRTGNRQGDDSGRVSYLEGQLSEISKQLESCRRSAEEANQKCEVLKALMQIRQPDEVMQYVPGVRTAEENLRAATTKMHNAATNVEQRSKIEQIRESLNKARKNGVRVPVAFAQDPLNPIGSSADDAGEETVVPTTFEDEQRRLAQFNQDVAVLNPDFDEDIYMDLMAGSDDPDEKFEAIVP